jgi:hypothetical protein
MERQEESRGGQMKQEAGLLDLDLVPEEEWFSVFE